VLQRWFDNNGFTGRGKQNKGKKKGELSSAMASMSDKEIINLFTRFFRWWVVEGRTGDTVKGGKQVRMSGHYGSTAAPQLSNIAVQQQQQRQLVICSTSGAGIADCVTPACYQSPQLAPPSVTYCMLMAAGARRAVRSLCCYEGTLSTAGVPQPPAPQCRPQQLSAVPNVTLPRTVPGVVQQEA
jgi:hypothetical protein